MVADEDSNSLEREAGDSDKPEFTTSRHRSGVKLQPTEIPNRKPPLHPRKNRLNDPTACSFFVDKRAEDWNAVGSAPGSDDEHYSSADVTIEDDDDEMEDEADLGESLNSCNNPKYQLP